MIASESGTFSGTGVTTYCNRCRIAAYYDELPKIADAAIAPSGPAGEN